jgi:hypothetical protein
MRIDAFSLEDSAFAVPSLCGKAFSFLFTTKFIRLTWTATWDEECARLVRDLVEWPGAMLTPSPLRTGREGFPSSGSSTQQRPLTNEDAVLFKCN